MELQRGSSRKAMKIFAGCTFEEPYMTNNEALINYYQGRKNTALFMLMEVKNPSPEVVYNLGVMNLFTGNYSNAASLLQSIISYYPKNPRLWLRLGESKLEHYKSECVDHSDTVNRKMDTLSFLAGDGNYRKMFVKAGPTIINDNRDLIYAKKCFLNSLILLERGEDVHYYPSKYPSEDELNKLKISAYLSLSYTCLCLNDYSQAHNFALCALKLSPEGHSKVLCNLYAGESLAMMGLGDDGLIYCADAGKTDWDLGRIVSCYNLAVTYLHYMQFVG